MNDTSRPRHLDLRAVPAAVSVLAAVISGSEDAIVVIDVERVVIGWNPGAERLFGYSEDEAVGQHVSLIIPDSRSGEEREILERVIAGERVTHYETQRCRSDGTSVWVELTVSALRDPEGRVVGASKIVRDITQLREARINQARLAAIIEGSDDGIYAKDDTGIITSWNPGAERMYGYSPEEAIGQPITLIIPESRRGEEKVLLGRILEGGRVEHYETERQRKDGTIIDVSLTISPLHGADGGIIGASVIGRDISDRINAQRMLERANRELERADRIKSDFLAMASHELRTPLTSIGGFTSTMLDMEETLGSDQRREFLQIIDQQVARLSRLVDDLLTLSRIESGGLHTELRPTPVDQVVTRTLRELDAPEVAVSCPAGLVAEADEDHLLQILVNFVSNAIKYGAGPVEVVAQQVDGAVTIAVADHGAGVPEGFRDRLFERFARADITSEQPGTGLGLSIVRGLAQAQGGEAWYEPNEPTGSRFCVRVPAAAASVS